MNDLDHREQAQIGLKYIEDSIVSLLTRHQEGMSRAAVADVLGLRNDLDPGQREMIAGGILELLVRDGRILWNEADGVYVDNPKRG